MLGSQWILQALKRNEYRHKHGISGNGCSDCMGAACCPCCGLVQEEKDSLLREAKGGAGGYQSNPGMNYGR